MLVSRHPLAASGGFRLTPSALRPSSTLGRAGVASLAVHLVVLALVTSLGGLKPPPENRMPPRLAVQLERRPSSATSDAPQPQAATTANADGARADGDAPHRRITLTPPEPWGDMPLLVDGMSGAAQLQLDVDANGKVTAVRVQTSTLEPATEREMVERMQALRFRPGLENGKPAASRLVLKLRVESSRP